MKARGFLRHRDQREALHFSMFVISALAIQWTATAHAATTAPLLSSLAPSSTFGSTVDKSDKSGCGSLPVATIHAAHGVTFQMAVHHVDRVSLDWDWMSMSIQRDGFWEIRSPQEMGSLANVTIPRPPAVFVDVGGNIGYYSLLFAKFGYRVYTFEPLHENRRAINQSLCLNPDLRARITVIPAAVGNPKPPLPSVVDARSDIPTQSCVVSSSVHRTGELNRGNGVMECGFGLTCKAHIARQRAHWMAAQSVRAHRKPRMFPGERVLCDEVRLVSIDQELQRLGVQSVQAMKIDIEGAECAALDGAQWLLSHLRPRVLQAETKQPHVLRCLTQQAEQHGYKQGATVGDNTAFSPRSR